MNILHLINHTRDIGNGIVNVCVDLACTQRNMGHAVAVASAGGEFVSLLEQYDVNHYFLDQRRKVSNIPRVLVKYGRILKEFQPDIVHAHMMTGAVLSRLMRMRFHFGLITTVHNEFQRSAVLMGVGDRVIAVSEAVKRSMIHRGIPEKKLCVILNGTIGSPRAKFHEPSKGEKIYSPRIVTVAGMYERKGIHDLIQAFAMIAGRCEHHLYLVGDGPDRPKFEKLANETPFRERIHFEGFQPVPSQYIRGADVFVLASYKEPFGLVLLEAREAGTAIVATKVDGIPEALDGGETGILVDPGNPVGLADAIEQLLQQPEMRNRLAKRASEGLEQYSVKRVCEETLSLYYELIK